MTRVMPLMLLRCYDTLVVAADDIDTLLDAMPRRWHSMILPRYAIRLRYYGFLRRDIRCHFDVFRHIRAAAYAACYVIIAAIHAAVAFHACCRAAIAIIDDVVVVIAAAYLPPRRRYAQRRHAVY